MNMILHAARCVAVAIALFTAADVVADDDRHGLNHYILDLISKVPVIGPGPEAVAGGADASCVDRGYPWSVIEIYSNADASVQFLVMESVVIVGKTGDLRGKTLISSAGSSEHAFTFPTDSSVAGCVAEARSCRNSGICRPRHYQTRFHRPERLPVHEQRLGQAP